MLGHDLAFTRTNANNWIPVCSCGWIGNVEVIADHHEGETARTLRRIEWAKDNCRAQHDEHCCDVRAQIEHESDLALAAHGRLIDRANESLQHRGRWGRP